MNKRVAVFPLRCAKQLRQLGDPGCDLARFVLGHETRRCASARFVFKVDIRHGKIVAVADDEAGVVGFVIRPLGEGNGGDVRS